MLSTRIADYLCLPISSRANVADITNSVLKALRICGTEMLIVDDIHFLDCSQKDGKLANDHLKYLANHCAATFVYAGVDVESSGLLSEGTSTRATQTAGRFSLLRVRPLGADIPLPTGKLSPAAAQQAVEWGRVVAAMEDALSLYNHQPGVLANNLWRYLLDRTSGRISSLSALLRLAAMHAIESGAEAIDRALLDSIPTDFATQAAYERRHRRAQKKRRSAEPTGPKTAALPGAG